MIQVVAVVIEVLAVVVLALNPLCSLQVCVTITIISLAWVMKFGKNLSKVIALSDPEWNPYWINYKFLKKKLKELLLDNQHGKVKAETKDSAPSALLQSSNEVNSRPPWMIENFFVWGIYLCFHLHAGPVLQIYAWGAAQDRRVFY